MEQLPTGENAPVALDSFKVEELQPGDVVIKARRWADLGGMFIRLGNLFKRGFHEHMWCHIAIYASDGEIIGAIPCDSACIAFGDYITVWLSKRREKQRQGKT